MRFSGMKKKTRQNSNIHVIEFRQKYSVTRRIFNSLLGVWKSDETLSLVLTLDIHPYEEFNSLEIEFILTWETTGKFKAAAIRAWVWHLQPNPIKASTLLSHWLINALIDVSSEHSESSHTNLRRIPGSRLGSLLMLSTAIVMAEA